jgi:predicted house-cleaning NTP pyrophosphatase (Maf/HAM1 superfamily)
MSDAFPDRLSINPKSPYYNEEILKRSVGIRFNGAEKKNVEEYCISEGWIKVAMGKSVDRHGNPLVMKLQGAVEPFFKEAS